jgi:hypothetical protein
MTTRPPFEVVYNSDLIIVDPSELSTLSIFYDQVSLPSTTTETSRYFIEIARTDRALELSAFERDNIVYTARDGSEQRADDEVIAWETSNKILFDEGVLRRLPEPASAALAGRRWAAGRPKLDSLAPLILRGRCVLTAGHTLGGTQLFYVRQDQVRHLLRSDITAPSLFLCSDRHPSREVLKALEAREVFRYLIPAAAALQPEEILEVRQKVRDTREGFAMHLQALSSEVEARLRGGESLDEVSRVARALVETTIIPDYGEFRRQIAAERGGFWRRVLEAGVKAFEIDVPPWTPKFYGDLLKAIGFTILTTAEERKLLLSNRHQAYQFMQRVESV